MSKNIRNTFVIKEIVNKNSNSRILYKNKPIPVVEIRSSKISFPESNIDVIIDNKLDIKNKKILVLSLVRNCSYSIVYIEKFIKDLLLNFEDVKFCFFSNNNQDDTINLLNDLSKKYWSKILNIYHKIENITKHNRINRFSNYRNICTTEAIKFFNQHFDYIIVFDSDLGDTIPINAISNSLKVVSPEWSCISGNHCYGLSSYYYDELALRFHDDPINIKEKFIEFDKFYGTTEHWVDELHIIDHWLDVKSAFGGVSIYKAEEIIELINSNQNIYDITNFPEYTAEHIALNLKLKNKILINPYIKYNTINNLEERMYNTPIAFVPRDAGFFSVFNFYIGCLSSGMRAYPYFNKDIFLKINNNKNEHFCYWTENENCWFDYFQPVSFFTNDNNHIDGKYKMFPKHKGELAPTEFRIPKDTHALIQDKQRFSEWRKYIHNFYSKYIRYTDEILNKVDSFFDNNFKNSKSIIGVHYRHPSHFIESGKVYLEQYFDKIDTILKDNPECEIFLATDSNFGIYAFQEKYQNKIKFMDGIERLSMPEFLQWCFSLAEGKADEVGFINGQGFELHHKRVSNPDNKKLTIDLLSEVLCLSKCNYLVHTTSNIALAISYMNPDLELISL